jgi:hypothetical protein
MYEYHFYSRSLKKKPMRLYGTAVKMVELASNGSPFSAGFEPVLFL